MNLPTTYQPSEYESNIYALWEKSNAFQPNPEGKSGFSVVVPPPNANGNLHIGHGLNHTIMDIVSRYQRLRGSFTLYLPGADHAGFETQVVYERELARQGKSRFDFTREELYQQIWDFVATNRNNYESQFRKIGDSVDWSRYTFTLDQKIINQANQTFKKMWDEGLVYRGERLVNFCTFHGTGFSDIEVEYKEEQGNLWYINYPLTDGSGQITVATTRPETMLGDTAVAVHPSDNRYAAFHGKTVKLPLTNREIPIITDDFVDPEFGTGAVKITPAHDPNDYDAGKRHDLPMITVITHSGTISHEVSEKYGGQEVLEARESIVKDLRQEGSLVKTEDHVHNVGHCYKCGTIIQPLLKEQWFIDMKPLAEPAIEALRAGKIQFHPINKCEQLIKYLENLRDWNISRQIAWGIPIPAFQSLDDPLDWIYDTRTDMEIIEVNGKSYKRDPDVFDTWFSSSSWPYATLDFPSGEDFDKFYPLSLMETGADILYPWVSRMIMLGLYVTGGVPFKTVYLHGLIQDEHGAKMSKSKGNVIDPMTKIDEFGADAFRLGIIADETAGQNRPYDQSKVIGARNFCNKLWNVARYIESVVGDDLADKSNPKPINSADHWVLSKLQHTVNRVSDCLDQYRFSEAYELTYHFVWDDFADWYIESSKVQPNTNLLAHCLESILKITHPFAPFLTETIWQTLKWEGDTLLATSHWPTIEESDGKKASKFEEAMSIVREIRYIKSELNPDQLTLYYNQSTTLEDNADLIVKLARIEAVKPVTSKTKGLRLASTTIECWLDLDDDTIKKFIANLTAKIETNKLQVKQLESRLSNESYILKAPRALVDETKQKLQSTQELIVKLTDELSRFDS